MAPNPPLQRASEVVTQFACANCAPTPSATERPRSADVVKVSQGHGQYRITRVAPTARQLEERGNQSGKQNNESGARCLEVGHDVREVAA